MSLLERLEVPAAKSRASSSATDNPRLAASSAAPAPVTPPPMTRTSTTSVSTAARSARRRAGDSRVLLMPPLSPRLPGAAARPAFRAGRRRLSGLVRPGRSGPGGPCGPAEVGLQVDHPGDRDGVADPAFGFVDAAGDPGSGVVVRDGDLRGDEDLVG